MVGLEYVQSARIKVFGVGGGGCNAVNSMVQEGVQGVEFYVANTDLQALNISPVKNKIILGEELTKGLGAGSNPDVGLRAAQESEAVVREAMKDADMIYITAGLGGGTGTGAAPMFAKIAKELGALTVGIVTTPFAFEGKRRQLQAESGLAELKKHVDSLVVISNNQLMRLNGNIRMQDAFKDADNVLRQGVQAITDLIAVPGGINVDFADVRYVMEGQGAGLFGVGMSEGQGESSAREAAERALDCPLLEANIKGAKRALVNITGGEDLTLFTAQAAIDYIREKVGGDLDVIYGSAINVNLSNQVIVTVIATGFDLADKQDQQEIDNTQPKTYSAQFVETKEENTTQNDTIPNFMKSRF